MSGNPTPNEPGPTVTMALRLWHPILLPPSENTAGPWQMVNCVSLFTGPMPFPAPLLLAALPPTINNALWEELEPVDNFQHGFMHPSQSLEFIDLLTDLSQAMTATFSPPAALPLSSSSIWIGSGLSKSLFPLAVLPELNGQVAAIVNHVMTGLAAKEVMLQGMFLRQRTPLPFDPVDFVDGLEQVDIASIPDEDMCCPHCWLPFGTTYEDDPTFEFMADPEDDPELTARQVAFRELPFCAGRADNNPVRTPCGHLYGRSCLIETLEKVGTRCPTCRQEMARGAWMAGVRVAG
jgi:hypothetical protein